MVARYLLWRFWLKLRGRNHRHGHAAVSFGAPLSLGAYQRERPDAGVDGLAAALMARIGAEVPVLPVPLVARALIGAGGAMDRAALDRAVADMLEAVPQPDPPLDPVDPVAYGLRILEARGMVSVTGTRVAIAPEQTAIVQYYAASIAHLFCERSAGG